MCFSKLFEYFNHFLSFLSLLGNHRRNVKFALSFWKITTFNLWLQIKSFNVWFIISQSIVHLYEREMIHYPFRSCFIIHNIIFSTYLFIHQIGLLFNYTISNIILIRLAFYNYIFIMSFSTITKRKKKKKNLSNASF